MALVISCGKIMCCDSRCKDCYPDAPLLESAFTQQVAGDHYKTLGIQPMEAVLINRGYEAFSGACYVKILKYMDRKKDNETEQLKKAQHILSMWIEESAKRT